MKKKMKLFVSALLCLSLFLQSILLLPILSFTVYASETEEPTTEDSGIFSGFKTTWNNWVNYCSATTGAFCDYSSSEWNNFKTLIQSYFSGKNGFEDNGDGTVTITVETLDSQTLEEIRDLLKDYIEQQEPYKTYLPDSFSENRGISEVLGTSMKPSGIVAMTTFFNQYKGNVLWGSSPYNWYRATVLDGGKYMYAYLDSQTGCVNFVDKDLVNAYACTYLEVTNTINTDALSYPQNEFTFDDITSDFTNYGVATSGVYKKSDGSRMTSVSLMFRPLSRNVDGVVEYYIDNYYGAPLVVFDSATDLTNWITKNPLAFTTNSFNMPITNNITLDPTTIGKYDDALMKKIYEQLVANGKNALTAEQMQKIIDDTIAAALGEIAGNTGETTEEVKYTNQILNAILHEMREFQAENGENINKIYKFLVGTTEEENETDILNEILTIFSVTSLLEVRNIFLYGDIGGENSAEYSAEMTVEGAQMEMERQMSGGGLVGTMSNSFPFCIPWDIYYIYLSFAEEPEPPRFEFPFRIKSIGYETTYVIDLGNVATDEDNPEKEPINFQMLSDISRSILTITFIMYLARRTQKQTKKGE